MGSVTREHAILKHEGHMAVEELVRLGMHKNQIYWFLANRLKVPLDQAHFKVMNEEQCERSIQILERKRRQILKYGHKKPKRKEPVLSPIQIAPTVDNSASAAMQDVHLEADVPQQRRSAMRRVAIAVAMAAVFLAVIFLLLPVSV